MGRSVEGRRQSGDSVGYPRAARRGTVGDPQLNAEGSEMGDLAAFDKAVLETARLIPRGHVTSYTDVAEVAGLTEWHRAVRVGWLVRKHAPKHSHRILSRHGKHALAVARGYSVPEGGFPIALHRLRDEGIVVPESGIVEKTARYLDANALRDLRARAAAQHAEHQV